MYLPTNVTIDEACEWLLNQTGQKWTLPRLLEEVGLTPYVGLNYSKEYPQIFGDRREGYLTKMVFHGDVMRLARDADDALLTMFTTYAGKVASIDPPLRVERKEIRFKRDDVQRVAETINGTKFESARGAGTPSKLSPEQKKEVVASYARGRGKSESLLARENNVSRPTITRLLKSAGVKR